MENKNLLTLEEFKEYFEESEYSKGSLEACYFNMVSTLEYGKVEESTWEHFQRVNNILLRENVEEKYGRIYLRGLCSYFYLLKKLRENGISTKHTVDTYSIEEFNGEICAYASNVEASKEDLVKILGEDGILEYNDKKQGFKFAVLFFKLLQEDEIPDIDKLLEIYNDIKDRHDRNIANGYPDPYPNFTVTERKTEE